MPTPKFESYAAKGGDPLHDENKYNLPNEKRDRREMEDESKRGKGQKPYVPIEEVEYKNAKQDIYDQVEESIKKEDVDEFGYIAMMNEIVAKLEKKEKDEFLNNVSTFISLHRKVVSEESLSDEEKDKLLREKFTQIFGHQVLSYNGDKGTTGISMHTNKYKKVFDKAAPAGAYKAEYMNKNGRSVAVDPSELATAQGKDRNFKKKAKSQGPWYKLPFRKSK